MSPLQQTAGFVLIVDDDRSLPLEGYLEGTSYQWKRAYSCEDALGLLIDQLDENPEARRLALVDIVLPIGRDDAESHPRGGLLLMKELKRLDESIALIPITGKGWGSDSPHQGGILEEAGRIGICDYISKPITRNEILAIIERTLGDRPKRITATDEFKRYPVNFGHGEIRYIVSSDKNMQDRVLGRVAMEGMADRPALIQGETGTGKELVARAVHACSGRARFHSVNCAAIPEPLIESELFGHERGAFSGAIRRKPGKFELAHGGTLFLDEVGDLSLSAQAKLLRVLQEQEFERIGGDETIRVDVRVVAATNQNLEERICDGNFRADLYYRLEGLVIEIPPLRSRRDDIELIARYFLEGLNQKHGTSKSFTDETLTLMRSYDWPGNVRELQNVVHNLYYSASGQPLLLADDLPSKVFNRRSKAVPVIQQLARMILEDHTLSLDVTSMLIVEEVFRQSGEDPKRAYEALEISPNTLYKYKRPLDDVSRALITSQFDEDEAARQLPDFGSVTFLRKRLRALLYGKSPAELSQLGRRHGYPDQWFRYMREMLRAQTETIHQVGA